MKKLDLHIHTKSTKSDREFEFSIEKLNEYIKVSGLDAIAITNHNVFDKQQYEEICNQIEITAFPGIEIDIEKGHMLVICPNDSESIEHFNRECEQISSEYDINGNITIEKFKEIFKELDKYLLIPHYKKEPKVCKEVLEELGEYIKIGEVSSFKKWQTTMKEEGLVPVIFSDERIDQNLDKFPVKSTYIDCDELTLPKIKLVLQDRKVSITSNNAENEFELLPDGTNASTKLNLVLGKRSSGKTYLLDNIYDSFNNSLKIQYIKQFSIVKKSDKTEFESIINKRKATVTEEYLKPLKEIIDKLVIDINCDENEYNISTYIETLKEFADNKERDAFSNTKLFNETAIELHDLKDLENLIDSFGNILKEQKYKDLIEEYIKYEDILPILSKLIEEHRNLTRKNILAIHTNELVKSVKESLARKSSVTQIADVNFVDIAKDMVDINNFNKLISKIKNKKCIIDEELVNQFKIKTVLTPIKNASELRKILGTRDSVSTIFKILDIDAFKYLQNLIEIGIDTSLLYKCFCNINTEVSNKNGTALSGGQKAEFNLLAELKEAYKNDILLIDEPESSFDNIFIKEEMITMIKELSQKTTIFLVTHNNSLGTLMKPDTIIYTENRQEEGENIYSIYTGKLTSKYLTDSNENKIENYAVLMDSMEAGEDAYIERKKIYEDIKN